MSEPKLNIHINLQTAERTFLLGMQAITQRVTLGMVAVDRCEERPIEMPGLFFSMRFGKNTSVDEQARQDFKSWIVGVGFREAMEMLEPLIVDMRFVAGLAKAHKNGTLVAPISGTSTQILEALRVRETKQFTKHGWPRKLATLKTEFGILIPYTDELLSINAARNCMTHRAGIVGAMDVNDPTQSAFVLRYMTCGVACNTPEGQKLIINGPGMVLPAGCSPAHGSPVPQQKLFKPGERLIFTAQEFAHIAYTICSIGIEIIKTTGQYMVDLDIFPTAAH